MKKWILPFLLWFFCLLSALNSAAQTQIKLYGNAPEYRGHLLVFYQYQNFINQQKEELLSVQVEQNGGFEVTSELSHPTYAFTYLGRYRAYIFLEPGRQYQLVLPPYVPLSDAQKLNPYFEPEWIELGIANGRPGELNHLIRDFDEAFNALFNANAFELYSSQNAQKAASIIDSLEARFPESNGCFNQHKSYHYARLKRLAARQTERQIIYQYYSRKPVLFYLPAYWQTFSELFAGAWEKILSSAPETKRNPMVTDSTSFDGLSQILASDTLFTRPDLRESVLVWALHEGFYKKTVAEHRCLTWMQQASRQASTEEVRSIAASLYQKMNQLRPGTPAPVFELYNLKGKSKNLGNFDGKFIYLNFMHTQNHACRKALENLAPIAEEFKRDLEVVTIFLDEESRNAEDYLNNHLQPKWETLFINNQSDVLENYDIQAVPAYFLIDPNGTLLLSPAPSPHEDFRKVFAQQQLNFRQKQQRERPGKERSVLEL